MNDKLNLLYTISWTQPYDNYVSTATQVINEIIEMSLELKLFSEANNELARIMAL